MIPRGVQNADAIIEAVKKTVTLLGEKAKPEWKTTLDSDVALLEDMKTKFFLKTNFAVPVTGACLKDATVLQSLAANGNLSKFPEALAQLQSSMEKLVSRGKMDGVSLT